MTDIAQQEPVFGIKKFMVFNIRSNISVYARVFYIRNKKTACPAANGHIFNRF